jgi:hypothetical protein
MLALCAISLGLAGAAEPPHYAFSPRPPGNIVQSVLFYPAGEGMQEQWRAVTSRVHLGGSAYQWYLSIYDIDYDAATYRLAYRSPGDASRLLSRITHSHGGPWLPLQSAHIVGVGELERAAVQDLVVQTHEASADCGEATVTVFAYDWTRQRIRPVAIVRNGCALGATLLHSEPFDAVQLVGPYYASGAPLCCPTKVRATAVLRYRAGRWVETPAEFGLSLP